MGDSPKEAVVAAVSVQQEAIVAVMDLQRRPWAFDDQGSWLRGGMLCIIGIGQ